MKAFLYARVSTGEQDEGMQLREMRELASRRKWEVEEFTERLSGAPGKRRPEFARMMSQARRGKCDVVVVYRFDRFARSSQDLINALEEFRSLKVEFVSVHEAIDTTTPMGKFAFTMIAAIAEFERELIRERTRSGIAQARAAGKRIGRPRAIVSTRKIKRLRALGRSWREVSETIGIGESTLRRLRSKTAGNRVILAELKTKDLQDSAE